MLPKALALADEIAKNAPALSVSLCKHLMHCGWEGTPEDAMLAESKALHHVNAVCNGDLKEGAFGVRLGVRLGAPPDRPRPPQYRHPACVQLGLVVDGRVTAAAPWSHMYTRHRELPGEAAAQVGARRLGRPAGARPRGARHPAGRATPVKQALTVSIWYFRTAKQALTISIWHFRTSSHGGPCSKL